MFGAQPVLAQTSYGMSEALRHLVSLRSSHFLHGYLLSSQSSSLHDKDYSLSYRPSLLSPASAPSSHAFLSSRSAYFLLPLASLWLDYDLWGRVPQQSPSGPREVHTGSNEKHAQAISTKRLQLGTSWLATSPVMENTPVPTVEPTPIAYSSMLNDKSRWAKTETT